MKKIILGSVTSLILSTCYLSAADSVFTGNFLKVGINDSGALIDNGFQTGISYDKTGTATFPPFDFLKPGTPFEFGAVGYNGSSVSFGYNHGNSISATTADTSSATVFSAKTTGGTYGALSISQDMWFGKNSGTIYFNVTLTNTSTTDMNDVVYARGLDPDQDVYAGGGFETTNAIVNGNLVTGTAPISDWTIGIFSDSTISHTPSVRADWSSSPYSLLSSINDGYGDYTINMAFDVGTLAASKSVSLSFEYRIAETKDDVVTPPTGVPDMMSTFGMLLGSLGILGFLKRRKN